MKSSLSRLPGESEVKYIYRMGSLKEQGIIDMTWTELADVFNRELRDGDEEWTESTYRKKYALMKQFQDEFGLSESVDGNNLKELRRELEKERIKFRDERNEYNKLIRQEARKESYLEQFVRTIKETVIPEPLVVSEDKCDSNGNCDMVINLNDIHFGMEIDNFWNKYDEGVLKKRLTHYLERIFEIRERHGCENAYVVIGEIVNGIIHNSLRIQSNQDLIEQFLTIIYHIADFLILLSEKFENVNVYVAPGNHSRINPKKEDGLDKENIDNLIIPFLEAKLQNYMNIRCYKNNMDHSVAIFTVRNRMCAAVHGDKDNISDVVENLWKLTGISFDIIFTGHKHTNKLLTSHDCKVVQSGCLIGMDEYAINNRLRNRPEQAVCIISEVEGLDCIYDIKFQ